MLAARKLVLVLDLDHTLLNSATYTEIDMGTRMALEAWEAAEKFDADAAAAAAGGDGADAAATDAAPDAAPDAPAAAVPVAAADAPPGAAADAAAGATAAAAPSSARPPLLYHLSSICMWTKLRPFTHEFLRAASKMYELCEIARHPR